MTDYAKISATLKEALHLTGSPVAVKLASSPEQIPAGIPEIEETVRHCRMVSLAREGKIFFAPDAKHQCGGGAWVLGLREIGPSMDSGEHYLKLGGTVRLVQANALYIMFLLCRFRLTLRSMPPWKKQPSFRMS